jgi:hypothetical protein
MPNENIEQRLPDGEVQENRHTELSGEIRGLKKDVREAVGPHAASRFICVPMPVSGMEEEHTWAT